MVRVKTDVVSDWMSVLTECGTAALDNRASASSNQPRVISPTARHA